MAAEKQVRRVSLTVPPERAGQKVDTLLRKELGLSGTVIRRVKWLEDGILLDGARVFTSCRVEPGQVLTARLSDPERRSGVVPAPGPLDIVYEDGDILVLNKAPGVLVHPGAGHFSDTIGNFLLNYYDQEGIEADFHPVHRLDKGTSGLMVAAKHPHAQEVLKNQLHTPAFRRVYLAVCLGSPPAEAGVVEAPIGRAGGGLHPGPGGDPRRPARPDGLPGPPALGRAHPGGAHPGDGADPPDPGPHGPPGLPPGGGLPLRGGGPGPHLPPRPPLLAALPPPARHRGGPLLHLPPAGGYGPAALTGKRRKGPPPAGMTPAGGGTLCPIICLGKTKADQWGITQVAVGRQNGYRSGSEREQTFFFLQEKE